MAYVGGEYHPSAPRVDADKLNSRRMTTDRMDGDTGRDLSWSIVQAEVSAEIRSYQRNDILGLVATRDKRIPDVTPTAKSSSCSWR